MSELRKPGTPGGSRGKSESQKNQAPLQSGNLGGGTKSGGHCVPPVTPGRTSGNRNKIR